MRTLERAKRHRELMGERNSSKKKSLLLERKKKLNKDLFDGQSDEPAKKKKTRKLLIV